MVNNLLITLRTLVNKVMVRVNQTKRVAEVRAMRWALKTLKHNLYLERKAEKLVTLTRRD
jgi:hypothetical protein